MGKGYRARTADSQGNLGKKVQRYRKGGENVQLPRGAWQVKGSVNVDGFENYPRKETEKEPFTH